MIDQRIIRFIRRHHVMVLATCVQEQPYCADLFYAYDATRNRLVFSSDTETRHAGEFLRNRRAAASIVLETRTVGRLQGLQICGTVLPAEAGDKSTYLKRFPYAAAAPLTLWALTPDLLKYTDNTLGFGTKLIWKDPQQE